MWTSLVQQQENQLQKWGGPTMDMKMDITEYFPAKLDWSAHLCKPFTFIEFILGTCNWLAFVTDHLNQRGGSDTCCTSRVGVINSRVDLHLFKWHLLNNNCII